MGRFNAMVLRILTLFIFLYCSSTSAFGQTGDIKQFDYTRADSIANHFKRAELSYLKGLSDSLTIHLNTDLEKFRAIYRWVCNNIENDYGLYAQNKRKREKLNDNPEELEQWNKELMPKMWSHLIKQKRTVCTGYAFLIKELCYHADINAEIVNGYGRSAEANIGGPGFANHSWNAVQLNDRWYLCDATWSSGFIDASKAQFIKRFDEAYFLTDPKIFLQNHYPIDTKWMLFNSDLSLESYLNRPLVYRAAIRHELYPITHLKFDLVAKKKEVIDLLFTISPSDQDRYLHAIIVSASGEIMTTTPVIESTGENIYQLSTSISRTGMYALHLMINEEYALTYQVTISN